jgi:cytochrome c
MGETGERVKGEAALALLCLALAGCGNETAQVQVAGGDHKRGREFLERYGCGSCHLVPGIASARGQVGPPLDGIGRRSYLGGVLPNTPDNMVAWIRHPQKFEPDTAMPDLGVSEPEARDMTAYLYTIR